MLVSELLVVEDLVPVSGVVLLVVVVPLLELDELLVVEGVVLLGVVEDVAGVEVGGGVDEGDVVGVVRVGLEHNGSTQNRTENERRRTRWWDLELEMAMRKHAEKDDCARTRL